MIVSTFFYWLRSGTVRLSSLFSRSHFAKSLYSFFGIFLSLFDKTGNRFESITSQQSVVFPISMVQNSRKLTLLSTRRPCTHIRNSHLWLLWPLLASIGLEQYLFHPHDSCSHHRLVYRLCAHRPVDPMLSVSHIYGSQYLRWRLDRMTMNTPRAWSGVRVPSC